ncbi:aminopeptidase [Escherichia coli]|nr:aminopeptidase [Escherichia coli]
MICAHMDEVGFMVRSISREGAIDALPVGNFRTAAPQLPPAAHTTRHDATAVGLASGRASGATISRLPVEGAMPN